MDMTLGFRSAFLSRNDLMQVELEYLQYRSEFLCCNNTSSKILRGFPPLILNVLPTMALTPFHIVVSYTGERSGIRHTITFS